MYALYYLTKIFYKNKAVPILNHYLNYYINLIYAITIMTDMLEFSV